MINPLARIRNYDKSIKNKFYHSIKFWIQSAPYGIAHKLGFKLLSLAQPII